MSATWKDWTRTDWYNAAYCEHCGLPLLEIADNEDGTRGHYECIYCTWMDDHDVETNSLRAQVAALQAALEEANEDAARLASVLEDDGYPVKRLPMNAKRLSLAAHRARVGGAS